jgi:prepilin-type N-terminal cleavage/methylation domain-containing protein/prepilin-type processing-associated H-X9-DG protein
MNTPTSRPAAGFTLIELLVVISIIALLIGILLPALGAARDSARSMMCMANMRSLAQAANNYTIDSGGLFCMPDTGLQPTTPTGSFSPQTILFRTVHNLRMDPDPDQTANWFIALDRYLGQSNKDDQNRSGVAENRNYNEFKQDPVWWDFSDAPPEGTTDARAQTEREANRTIKMNRNFRRGGAVSAQNPENAAFPVRWKGARQDNNADGLFRIVDQFVHIDKHLQKPSETVLFVDGLGQDITNAFTGSVTRFSASSGQRVGLRHANDSANAAFTDGSARNVVQPTTTETALNNGESDYAQGVEPETKQWFPEYGSAGGGGLGDTSRQGERNPNQELLWDMIRDMDLAN